LFISLLFAGTLPALTAGETPAIPVNEILITTTVFLLVYFFPCEVTHFLSQLFRSWCLICTRVGEIAGCNFCRRQAFIRQVWSTIGNLHPYRAYLYSLVVAIETGSMSIGQYLKGLSVRTNSNTGSRGKIK
jgi:hypothetical protein